MGDSIDKVWVELVGKIIIARINGEVTSDAFSVRHERILQIEQDTGCKKLLLDDLQMGGPAYAEMEGQRALTSEWDAIGFKIAIVVPNSRMAYLARLQFNGDNHKVFYNDMVEALAWLAQ
jgi:hypothetical protein